MSNYTSTPAEEGDRFIRAYCHNCQEDVYAVSGDISYVGIFKDTGFTCPRCFKTIWVDAPVEDKCSPKGCVIL